MTEAKSASISEALLDRVRPGVGERDGRSLRARLGDVLAVDDTVSDDEIVAAVRYFAAWAGVCAEWHHDPEMTER